MLINAYCTHRSPPPLAFPHVLHGRRDRTDPELSAHLAGLAGFVTQRGTRPMTASLYAVLRHVERVAHHLSLEVGDPALDAFASWARSANAILFLPDQSVRSPLFAVLVDPATGAAAPDAGVPHPADAQARKTRIEASLAERGLRAPPHLPPVVSETEVELRTASEVAARSRALYVCAVRAESILAREPMPPSVFRQRMPDAEASMSPKERAFFSASAPTEHEALQIVWRYEALAVLAWSIGVLPELPFPSAACDVPALSEVMYTLDRDALLAKAALVPTPSLLDALDLHYRLHWATTEARVRGTPPPPRVESGVVQERHYALNWLTRFGDAAWDDVQTPT